MENFSGFIIKGEWEGLMWPVLCLGSQQLGVCAGGQCLQCSFNNIFFMCILLQRE